jgi:hypothetical protein
MFGSALWEAPSFAADTTGIASWAGRYRVGTGYWILSPSGGALGLRARFQDAVDALFPREDSTTRARDAELSRQAVALVRCLAAGACADSVMARIDPYGFTGRDAEAVTAAWRADTERLGPLAEVHMLGTTGLRGRDGSRRVTGLQLEFARGSVDEHVIWYADDEIYMVRGPAATFELVFRGRPGGGLIGFDLLSRRVFAAERDSDSRLIVMESGRTVSAAPMH